VDRCQHSIVIYLSSYSSVAVILVVFIDNILIINSDWLNVDKVIFFFESYSKFAPRPTINYVKPKKNNNKNLFNQ
jgi:hypothetical protein